MLEILNEHPFIIGICGVFVTGVAIFLWLQTARKEALIAGCIAFIITAGLVLLSINLITDRERITLILDEVAVALKANDHDRVFSYIHPNAVDAVRRAEAELPNYAFTDARVTRIRDIKINNATTPPTAIAEFTVVVNVNTQGMQYNGPRLIRVYFMQRDGRWLVRDYEHTAPTASGFPDEPEF